MHQPAREVLCAGVAVVCVVVICVSVEETVNAVLDVLEVGYHWVVQVVV